MPIVDPFKQQGEIPNIEITGTEPQPKQEQSLFDKYLGIGSPIQRVVAGAINEPLMAIGQAVIDPFTESKPVQQYAKRIAEMEQARRAEEGDTGLDIYKLGGAIISPVNYLAGAGAVKAGLTGAKAAATTGGVTGLFAAPTLEEDVALGKLKQTGIGAGAGVAGQVVGKAIGGALAPKVSVEEQILRDLGVTPTTGESVGGMFGEIEKTLAGVPVLKKLITPAQKRTVESFNLGIFNKPLAEAGIAPLESGYIGQKAMKAADDRISSAYNDVLKDMSFTLDPDTVAGLATARTSKELTAGQLRVVDRKLAELIGTKIKPGQQIEGKQLKEIESAFKQEVARFDKSPIPGQNDIGDVLDNALSVFKDSIKKQNPEYADQLSKIDKSFAQLETLRLAVNKAKDRGGVFSPQELLDSVGEAAKSRIGKKYTSYGTAFLQPEAQAAQEVFGRATDASDWGKVGLLGAAYGAWNNPLAAIGTAAGTGILYTRLGQKVADTLIRTRPEEARIIAEAISGAGGNITPAIAAQINRVIQNKEEVSQPVQQPINIVDPFRTQNRPQVQPQSKAEVVNTIAKAAQNYGKPELTGLLSGIAKVESNFDPNAKSKSSTAAGMFQFTKATQKDYGLTNPHDAYQSAGAAAAYIDKLMQRYKGDKVKALAAYNQGPGVIDKGLNKAGREYAMKVLAATRNI